MLFAHFALLVKVALIFPDVSYTELQPDYFYNGKVIIY
jgi:hypothetical protein